MLRGTIHVSRTKRGGYHRSYDGDVETCCHRVHFSYDITDIPMKHSVPYQLEEEAEDRAKACITKGIWCGELNCLVDDDTEVFGTWAIVRD
jgi:hypothetical protein